MNINEYDWGRLEALGYPQDFVERMKNDPCWKGYAMVGKKKKGGRTVPNCVPVDSKHSEISDGRVTPGKTRRHELHAGPSAGSPTFAEDDEERVPMAIGYPQQSYVDKDSMPCNKPRPDTGGDKSHVVKACYNGKQKLIHFGSKGVKGSPKKEGESEAYRARREAWKARHAANIKKGPSSAAYWANKTKW